MVAQNQDDFCASTDPVTGIVTLTWHYDFSSQFTTYDIKWGTTLTPTNTITIPVTGADMSYTIPGINGLNTRYYFHVFGSSTISLDAVFSNIVLTLSPPAYDIAHLKWNPVYFPDSGNYSIQRFENSTWSTVTVITNNGPPPAEFTYDDTLSYPFCDTTSIKYRISFNKQGNPCNSLSNEVMDDFIDQFPPSNPANDTVSIYNDPSGVFTGCPVIGWTGSPEKGVAGYIIFREDPVFFPIDTIPPDSTMYIDKSVRACLQSHTYALVAIDSCGRTSYGTYTLAPHSLVLNVSPIDPCEQKAYLSWNAYTHMPGDLGGYIVYRKVNSGNFEVVDTVSSSTTAYADSILFINGNAYSYFIQAYSSAGPGTSSSCQSPPVIYYGPVIPDTLYIEQASVVNNNMVEVRYYYTPANRVRQLLLERGDSPGGPYISVGTLTASGNNFLPQESILNDPTADVQNTSYYYRIAMVDSCNKVAMYSGNLARTIQLNCSGSGLNSNQIGWNEYGSWYQGVDRYEVYRMVDGILDPSGPLAVVTSSPFEYTDNIQSLAPSAQTCYYVKAFEGSGNPIIANAFSESNICCAYREAILTMPTAFRPEGINSLFRPVQVFVAAGSFTMQVFNKWGQLIFETSDISRGWDGTVNGSPAPAEVYIYHITYKSMKGESFEKRGGFTLVR